MAARLDPSLHALVLADGDRPDRAGLDRWWPGWADGIGLVVAADGGAHLAADLGLAPDRWLGDGDSVDPAALAALEARGVAVIRASPDKDESDTELALLDAVAAGAGQITVLGALGGRRLDHLLANIALLAHPALAGVPTRLLDERTRVTLVNASGSGAAIRRDLAGRAGDVVSLLPIGGDVAGVVTSGLRYPLRDEPLAAGPARGLSNVRERPDAWIEVRGGRLLVVEIPCYARAMTMPAAGDAAPEIALPDDSGVLHRLADRRGQWTVVYFYPRDDTTGCTIEACEFRDANDRITERGAEVWGISPQGGGSKRAFREKFGLPFTLLADESHEAADAWGTWVEKQNYGKTYWGTARATFLVGPDGRIAQAWPKVKPEGHATEVLAALDEARAAHVG